MRAKQPIHLYSVREYSAGSHKHLKFWYLVTSTKTSYHFVFSTALRNSLHVYILHKISIIWLILHDVTSGFHGDG